MLVNCPECELQVSDKAVTCPHCGYPLKPTQVSRPRVTSNKRRRLPNGFGQISEIKGKRLRKPFRAMITVGKSESGRPICKPLKPESYFESYNDAYLALVEYHRNPYDVNSELTMKELYEQWKEEYFKKNTSRGTRSNITTAWNYCGSLYDMKVADIRVRHLKDCIENGHATIRGEERNITAPIQQKMKSLFNMLLDYAVECEITDKNYARMIRVKTIAEPEDGDNYRGHISFTADELQKLWDNVASVPYVDLVLISCYSGWRPSELGKIRLDDTDLQEKTFKGGIKTNAGKNRIVPIHPRIFDLVKNRYDEAKNLGSEYLFNCADRSPNHELTYYRYRQQFDNICDVLGLNKEHRPHDGRKTFVTLAKEYNVDEYAIKYLIGHTITDLTERVYTDRSVAWLRQEIEKIR